MKFLKKRKTIERENGVPYLIRWNLFECQYFSIKIHRILVSDHDCLHDHPWAFISIILKGGYVELLETSTGIKSTIKHPGTILYRRATDKHKLQIHQPATTFVITFKKVRQWGFWTKTGWIPWFLYDAKNSCE